MTEFLLEREQLIPRPLEETFAFFGDAGNLEAITPPWLGFQILTPKPIPMHLGAHIDYRIRLHGLPLNWKTKITGWDPPHGFVDEQLKGPYRLWHHTHTFEAIEGGTRICDRVRYALPLGFVGRLGHWFVQRDLKQIFDFRERKVNELLGNGKVP